MNVINSLGQGQSTPESNVTKFAKRSIFLSLAGGWTGTTLPDGGISITETSTNKVNWAGTKFVASASNANHEFGCAMPPNYNGGTITAKPYFWTASTDANSHTIIFGLQAVCFGDGDAIDAAYGTAQESSITVASSVANVLKVGPSTPAITIAGTPDGGKWIQFRTYRKGDDTHTGDIILLGWLISYTTDNYSDE